MRGRVPMIVAAAALLVSPPASAAAAPPEWSPLVPGVSRPDGAMSLRLSDVAALSPTDAWVIGTWWDQFGHTFAAHWDGADWRQTSTPDSTEWADQLALTAVDALATRDVWAVGSHATNPPAAPKTESPLAMHYDGAAWSTVPTPDTRGALADIDMLSADDGWAVGRSGTGIGDPRGDDCLPAGDPTHPCVPDAARPLAMRWRSGQWVTVDVPFVSGAGAALESVHARSANDVWAVGSQLLGRGISTLVMHWDGVRWSTVASPNVGVDAVGNELFAVTAVSATEAWAVGTACDWNDVLNLPCQPLALRLCGGQWRPVPLAGDSGTHLRDVVARSADDVWVVGYNGPTTGPMETNHIEHWDGHRFTTVPTAGPMAPAGALASALSAATVIPGSRALWAVGWTGGFPEEEEAQLLWHG